jgi:uroporphyrinogen decarboxylase
MMTFAAHYIEQPLSRYYLDHKILVHANIAVQERFELDILQAISDPFRETADFGAEILFPEDNLPICPSPPLGETLDLRVLFQPISSPGPRMTDRLMAIQSFRESMGGEVPIMGWVEGALAQAADLRGVLPLLYDLYDRPTWVRDLLEFCVEVEIEFAREQILAGADIIGLGDAVASQISPQMYSEFALPYEQRIFEAVHQLGALARLHICGDTNHLLKLMPASGADIIDLDWMVPIAQAKAQFNPEIAICGNFDPVVIMLHGSPTMVREATLRCLEEGGLNVFSAAGCEIPDDTPHLNLDAHTAAIKEFSEATKEA